MLRRGRTGNELHYCDKCKTLIYKYVPEGISDIVLFGKPVKKMKIVKIKPYYMVFYNKEFCSDCYTPNLDTAHF